MFILENSVIRCMKRNSEIVIRMICSLIVLAIFIIGYGETEYLTNAHSVIFATSDKFGTLEQYSIYMKPIALYSVPIAICIYAALFMMDKHIIVNSKWRVMAVFIAIAMAFWHVLSDSYYYVLSANLFFGNIVITLVLLLGNSIVFYKLVCLLVSGFLYHNECVERPLRNVERYIGTYKIFFLLWILFMICWFPRLVLNYPMAFDWDTGKMFHTALDGVDHGYPIAQITILKLVYRMGCIIGSVENVFFAYMCLKFLLSTLLFATIMFYFQQKKCLSYVWYTVLATLLCCPIFQSWSIFITKDSNYSICFTGMICCVCILILDKEFVMAHKFFWGIMLIVFANGVFWFRGNGIYIDITFFITGLLSFLNIHEVKRLLKKIYCKHLVMAAIFLAVVGLLIGISAMIVDATKNTNENFVIKEENNAGGDVNGIDLLKQQGEKYLKYYIARLEFFFRTEALRRYAVIARSNCPEEVIEILGDELSVFYSLEYTADNGQLPGNIEMDADNQEALMKYIIKNEPALVLDSIITKIHGYFDLYRYWVPTYEGGMSQGTYKRYELERYWRNDDEWRLKAYSTVAAYNTFRDAPILGITCRTGIYVWLLIITSIYLIIMRGRKVLCMLSPCWLTFLGVLVSGYNAYMRLSLPFVFSIPVLLLLCATDGRE